VYPRLSSDNRSVVAGLGLAVSACRMFSRQRADAFKRTHTIMQAH
jgi:hypothetical protein